MIFYHGSKFKITTPIEKRSNPHNDSIISKRMKALKITNKEISEISDLSVSTINSLRNRYKDIKKLNAISAIKLADVLKINIKSLMNN